MVATSVPSNTSDPSIIETNPVAVVISSSVDEKTRGSPTLYFVPTSSIAIPSIVPVLILSTLAVASPLPIPELVSSSISSFLEYKIPIIGDFQVYNSLCAICLVYFSGIPITKCLQSIKKISQILVT